jgi:hypothetical protein
LIEFALIVPGLLIMLIGVAFIAQGFNLQIVLHGAAYEGARVWAKSPQGGDIGHCTPPACDPNGQSNNFESYIIPVVRQYLNNNGFDGRDVIFYSENPAKYQQQLVLFSNNTQLVNVTLLYPLKLPIGNLAEQYSLIYVTASCTLKRGA